MLWTHFQQLYRPPGIAITTNQLVANFVRVHYNVCLSPTLATPTTSAFLLYTDATAVGVCDYINKKDGYR